MGRYEYVCFCMHDISTIDDLIYSEPVPLQMYSEPVFLRISRQIHGSLPLEVRMNQPPPGWRTVCPSKSAMDNVGGGCMPSMMWVVLPPARLMESLVLVSQRKIKPT